MTFNCFKRATFYLFVGLVTVEIAARIEDFVRYGASPVAPYSINSILQSGPYGLQGKPRSRYAKWSMNSLGFRGPEPIPNRVNVVIFGASESFGIYESPEAEYPRQLEALLNSDGRRQYNVINGALPGMRLGRTTYLERVINITRAKYVVVYPSPAGYIGLTSGLCGKSDIGPSERYSWTDYVRLIGRLEQLAKAYIPVGAMTALRSLNVHLYARNHEVLERVPEESLEAFRSDLDCVVKVTLSHGAFPVLVTHATYFGGRANPDDQPMMLAWRRFYPDLAEVGFLDLENRANAAIRAVARNTNTTLVDAATLVPRGPKYFADFVHFTDAGASRMAALIAAQINNNEQCPRDRAACCLENPNVSQASRQAGVLVATEHRTAEDHRNGLAPVGRTGNITLPKLHRVLQAAMGWTNSHLQQFVTGGVSYSEPDPDCSDELSHADERRVILHRALGPDARCFGDDWHRVVLVEDDHPVTQVNR